VRPTMSATRSIKYLAYAILLFGYLILSGSVRTSIQNAATTTFHPWPYVFIIYNLIQILFGVLLGLEQLIRQFRQGGHWYINVEKAVFLGLPPLALYSIYMLYFGQVIPAIGSGFFMREVMLDTWLQSYAGVVLGYALATVFQKSEQEIKT